MFFAILSSVLSGITAAGMVALFGWVYKKLKSLIEDFKELKESQRNQIKSQIVNTAEHCKKQGYITYMQLETFNRLADSYYRLGGNSYIHTVVDRANNELDVTGDPIPPI